MAWQGWRTHGVTASMLQARGMNVEQWRIQRVTLVTAS
jgi:hypothetical protein